MIARTRSDSIHPHEPAAIYKCTISPSGWERSADSASPSPLGPDRSPTNGEAERPPRASGVRSAWVFRSADRTCWRSGSEAIQLDMVDGAPRGLDRGQDRTGGADAQPLELDLGLAR